MPAKKQKKKKKKKKKKIDSDKGGSVGQENTTLGIKFCSIPFLMFFEVDMYVFEVKESIFLSFVRIGSPAIVEMAILCQFQAQGRFVQQRPYPYTFPCFSSVR